MARKKLEHASRLVPDGSYEDVEANNAAIEARVLAEAKQWCAAHGLDTREKQMAFIKKTLREGTLSKPLP